ncbi:MAG TPA: hypothetical protein DIS94_00275 [Bacteroidetes bacterium]|nr:hypothetical protein [Bacteroidota bacterium]
MKKIYTTTSLIFVLMISLLIIRDDNRINFEKSKNEPKNLTELKKEKKQARKEFHNKKFERGSYYVRGNYTGKSYQEFLMLRDPATNKIPDNIRTKELEYAKNLPKVSDIDNPEALTWQERGPNNIGGRTRALGVDVRTTAEPYTLIAGGVSGGIWKSTNTGANWTIKIPTTDLHNSTCIAQDVRTIVGDFDLRNIWYVGSGEALGNSASGTGASFQGNGIFKSLDNGETWTLIPSTVSNTPTVYDNPFEFVNALAFDRTYVDAVLTEPMVSINAVKDTVGRIFAAASSWIMRSNNGGKNWSVVLGDGMTYNSVMTDVDVTTTGIVYATIPTTAAGNTPGIYKSINGGTNWTNITPMGFPANYTRFEIGIAPSDENIVYFFGHTPGTGKLGSDGDRTSMWRYNNGTDSWTNLTDNMPNFVAPVAGNNSQGAYNLVVKVKPDDPNYVIFGSTNLYRSTDGFGTLVGNTGWIGGYATINNISQYANQHPDQHSFIFLPGSNVKVISGHDGGLSYTADVTTNLGGDPVAWTKLNNSYNVTQFYSVSLDPQTGSNFIMGGAQDNGTVATNTAGLSAWTEVYSGDGGYTEIAPLADDRIYPSSQNGDIIRLQRDGGGYQACKPTGSIQPLFINPYILDPNNSNILYFSGGSGGNNGGVWRNNDIKNCDGTTGWTYLTTSAEDDQVSAFGVSTLNNANVVYYGTSNGDVYRIDDAHTGTSPTRTNITLPEFAGRYVSSIAVDPDNSNNVMVVFSNYNVERVYYSSNAGANWVSVGGNLNAPNAPSVRWAQIFTVSGVRHFFLATSTGVYYTITLNGGSTVWTQEAVGTIGNVVTTMFDFRSVDNTLIAATHGRGMFSTNTGFPLPVELSNFNFAVSGNNVSLKWTTTEERNNSGFEIERRNSNSENWSKIGFVEGSGNSNEIKNYSYSDLNLISGKYNYRLKQIDYNGNFKYYNLESEVIVGVPDKYLLSQNYPNPFNPITKINFELSNAGFVKLEVYDLTGRLVKTLINENKPAGYYEVEFNGNNFASGVYFYKLNVNNFSDVKRMILVK